MQAATTIDVKHGFANNGSRYGVICKVICRVICRVIFRVTFCKCCYFSSFQYFLWVIFRVILRVIFNILGNCVNKCTCHQPQILVCSNNFDLIQLRAWKCSVIEARHHYRPASSM